MTGPDKQRNALLQAQAWLESQVDIASVHADMEDYADMFNAVLALIDDALQEPSGWQSIKTAPKDGTQIDLWLRRRGRVTDCVWGEAISGPHEGNRVWLCNGLDRRLVSPSDVTHWMPLPTAPQGEG